MPRTRRWLTTVAVVTAATAAPLALSATTGGAPSLAASSAHPTKAAFTKIGTASLTKGGLSAGEIQPSPDTDNVDGSVKAVANRSPQSRAKATRTTTAPSGVTPTQSLTTATDTSSTSWQGINHYDQRNADGGNQWSLVPPDQALCTNGTEVVEGVNNAIAVYTTTGALQTDYISINQLFWHDHEIDRTGGTGASPHQMGDPDCVWDAGSQHYFFTVYDLLSDSTGNPTGTHAYVDIAVSPKGTAVGTWTTYQVDVTDDGTNGTPSHPGCPCFGDYPHIGTDANGLYITTNEYPIVNPGYNPAQVYAVSKNALINGSGGSVTGVHIDTLFSDLNQGTYYAGSTLAPALSDGTAYATANGGTMYFLSSDSYSGDTPILSKQILLWTLSNTSALNSSDPTKVSFTIPAAQIPVSTPYFPPPAENQKAGVTPLADCLNDTACAKAVLGTPDKYKEYEYSFDASDTRMLQAAYAHGKLWAALDTAVDIGGTTKAGVAYYVVDPTTGTLVKDGTLAVPGNNISYPALGVTPTGKAVMALTLSGDGYYPSAAYVRLDDQPGTTASPVTIVGLGQSPDDDFSGYRGFAYDRPRWGDYGAAAVSGGTVWIASEYIAQQTCSLSQFEQTGFTCGNQQRTALANWATRVTAVAAG